MCYYAALSIYIFEEILFQSMVSAYLPMSISVLLRLCSLLFIGMSELLGIKQSRMSLLGFGILILFTVITLVSDLSIIAILGFLIWGSRSRNIRNTAIVYLATVLISCIFVVGTSVLQIVPDYVWIHASSDGIRIRHSLGFLYTTYASHYLLAITMALVFLMRGKMPLPVALILLTINQIIYILTTSRNAYILTIAVLASIYLFRFWLERKDKMKTGAVGWAVMYPVVATLSIALMVFYSPTDARLSKLDEFLGYRISISNYTYNTYGIEPLGQLIDYNGQGLNRDWENRPGKVTFVDNSFCNALLSYGPIAITTLLLCYSIMMFRIAKYGQRLILFLLGISLVHVFVDSWWLYIQYNYFILLIGPIVFHNCFKNKEGEIECGIR